MVWMVWGAVPGGVLASCGVSGEACCKVWSGVCQEGMCDVMWCGVVRSKCVRGVGCGAGLHVVVRCVGWDVLDGMLDKEYWAGVDR